MDIDGQEVEMVRPGSDQGLSVPVHLGDPTGSLLGHNLVGLIFFFFFKFLNLSFHFLTWLRVPRDLAFHFIRKQFPEFA